MENQKRKLPSESRSPKRPKLSPLPSTLIPISKLSTTNSINLWLSGVQSEQDDNLDPDAVATMDASSETRTNSTRTKSRSSSPTKPSVQVYRAQVLERVHIKIDVVVPSSVKQQLLPREVHSASHNAGRRVKMVVEERREDLGDSWSC